MITNRWIDPGHVARPLAIPTAVVAVYSAVAVLVLRGTESTSYPPIELTATVGVLVAVLLGLKTHAAYERWWEASKVWGRIVSDSRTFARQALTFLVPRSPGDEQAVRALHRDLVYRQIAWVHTMSRSLRDQDPLQGLDAYLFRGEVNELIGSFNRANAILQRQGEQLRGAYDAQRIDSDRFDRIESMVTRMADHQGDCERIKETAFPADYSAPIKIGAWIFLALLPWGLVWSVGWLTVPVTVMVAIAYFAIDQIADTIADPFENRPSDTPITALAQLIEIDLRQQLGEADVPEILPPVDGILM